MIIHQVELTFLKTLLTFTTCQTKPSSVQEFTGILTYRCFQRSLSEIYINYLSLLLGTKSKSCNSLIYTPSHLHI